MEITDEHLEYATVERLRDMLIDVNDTYQVTHSYAFFTTILCWVMQRVRNKGSGPIDILAREVLEEKLRKKPIEEGPWSIVTEAPHNSCIVRAFFPEFKGFTAERFLVALRDAVAHGDGRKIKPVNRGNRLIGYDFMCEERKRHKDTHKTVWTGNIVLLRPDMRRIGCALADLYCNALSGQNEQSPNSHLANEAKTIREKGNAAA